MKEISAKNKNFNKLLDDILSKRKNKLRSDYISVKNIIKDVRKNGDKALVKYEKRFNKNKTIIPTSKKIKDSIKSLDQKVKKAIDAAYNRIYKFHSLQKFKDVSYIDKYQNKVKRGCQTLNFFCSIERRDRDNAFYGVFEFQTSTSLATPARQKTHIVADLGVLYLYL